MNYLIYIEHAAENLQFFLWYQDYVKRFSQLPSHERALATEWTLEQAEAEAQAMQARRATKQQVSEETVALFKCTDFGAPVASVVEIKGNPFNTPPTTPLAEKPSQHTVSHAPSEQAWSDYGSTIVNSTTGSTFKQKVAGAFEGADVKLKPCEHLRQPLNTDALSMIKSPFNPSEKRSPVSSPYISLRDLPVS